MKQRQRRERSGVKSCLALRRTLTPSRLLDHSIRPQMHALAAQAAPLLLGSRSRTSRVPPNHHSSATTTTANNNTTTAARPTQRRQSRRSFFPRPSRGATQSRAVSSDASSDKNVDMGNVVKSEGAGSDITPPPPEVVEDKGARAARIARQMALDYHSGWTSLSFVVVLPFLRSLAFFFAPSQKE
jgi:hypothetical protein